MSLSSGEQTRTPNSTTVSEKRHKGEKKKQRKKPTATFPRASEATNNDTSSWNLEQHLSNDSTGQPLPKQETTKSKTLVRISRQRPKLYDLSKLDFNNFSRNTDLIRREIVKDKLLYQELAARLAEAKQSLAGLDSTHGSQPKDGPDSNRRGSNLKQVGHVSFLSVSRRVATIIRFRQAAQPKKSCVSLDKESSSIDNEILPKTPRFSSYMSPAAQYALMKGYEDIIFEKISSTYPECTGMLKRNKTPHHSIAISDRTNEDPLEHDGMNTVHSEYSEHQSRENNLSDCKIEEATRTAESEITSKDQVPQYISKKSNSNDRNSLIKNQTPTESFLRGTLQSSNFQNPNRLSSFSTQLFINTDKIPNQPKYGFHEAFSYAPEMSRETSPEPLGRDRRIHLSYRIENAMDILDTMKTQTEHTLSPRVKTHSQRQNAPLLDFNRWTEKWTNEFNSDAVK